MYFINFLFNNYIETLYFLKTNKLGEIVIEYLKDFTYFKYPLYLFLNIN